MRIKSTRGNCLFGHLIRATNELNKYLRNLRILCGLCGCIVVGMMIISNVWAGELEDLKDDELEKTQVDIQTKDVVQAGWTDEIEMGYKKGLYIKTNDGKYSLKLHFLLHPQYQYLVADGVNDINTFTLRRGQMRFFGNFFDPKLKFRVMFELPGTQGGTTANLRDMWVDWQWKKYFQIKTGQFLVFYDHENFEPSWALQFVDRSIINTNLGFERDIGINVHGKFFSDRMEYDLFLVNGDGRNQINLNDKFMTGGRIVMNILGKHNYFVSDLERSNDPNLAIGIAGIYDMGNASINNNELTRLTSDIAFRFQGFSVLVAANMAYNHVNGETDYGFLGQTGYFLFPRRFEVAGRWAKVYKNGALGTDIIDPEEVGVSLNYYFDGHHVKLQADYSHLRNNASTQDRDDDRVRLQLQLFF